VHDLAAAKQLRPGEIKAKQAEANAACPVIGDPAVSDGKGMASASFRFSVTTAPEHIKRAWLIYEVEGAGHWVTVKRTLNGGRVLGGTYRFASSAYFSQLEPLQPQWLVPGEHRGVKPRRHQLRGARVKSW
jgi:hypothetical protein